jgi:MFS family permease
MGEKAKLPIVSKPIRTAGLQIVGEPAVRLSVRIAVLAWVIAALGYFYQYVLRSAPSVMMPQLSDTFGISALALASILGLFYYGYAAFSLVAGAALDGLGPKKTLPVAVAIMGVGAWMFASGDIQTASFGRLLQGMGGAFAAVGAMYIASNYFSPARSATLIGATQMFGMAGGAAGQFAVGPLISQGLEWNRFWSGMAIAGFALGALLLILLPTQSRREDRGNWLAATTKPFFVVFKNPQSILCGFISGLLYIPTTIFAMIWGVRYLQDAHGIEYAEAVMRSATVPLGWIIGCPLLGFISDRLGRRKPVIIGAAALLLACLTWILFGPKDLFPVYTLGLLAGTASGAAMLPYTVIKEANPPQFAGTATGVVNFLNFSCSALFGPVFAWLLHRASDGNQQLAHGHYQIAFSPLLLGVAVAIGLTTLLKETGSAARKAQSMET